MSRSPGRALTSVILLALGMLVGVAAIGSGSALSTPPSNATHYVHDAGGRLRAVIELEGETAVLSWDAVSNLDSISRYGTNELSVVQLSPAFGKAGDEVTIAGTGFAETPSSNTVKFNGTSATVVSASAISLTVEVPEGATTGPVSVASGKEGPVSSPEEFTVGSYGTPPHISSISPTVAARGDEVTISGSNFDASIAANTVDLNGSRAELISSSESTAVFEVPAAVMGGPITVATPDGSDSGPDLYVAPPPFSAAEVGSTGRFSLNESKAMSLAASKIGLELFDATAGQKVAFAISESEFSGSISIWGPNGSQLSGGTGSFSGSGGGIVEPVKLPAGGTYTVLIDPSGEGSGSLKLSAFTVEDITGSIAPSAEGGKESVSIATPGQNARYSVTVGAGERVSVGVAKGTFNGWTALRWRNSKGEQISSEWWRWESLFWEPFEFSSAGTYTLEVDPESSVTGSADLTLWEVKDKSGESITPSTEGSSKTFSVDVPGQQNRIAMEGEAGQQISIIPSEASLSGSFSIEKPGGGTLSESEGGLGGIHGPLTLPESGTYKIVLDGSGSSTGSVKLTAYSFKDITGSIAPSAEGGKESVSIATPGQNARYSVTVGAGERVSVGVAKGTFNGWTALRWRNSKGEQISSEWWRWESLFWEPFEFSSAGTYTLEVDPESSVTGSADLTLWEVKDKSGESITPSTEGSSKTFSVDVPGQQNRIAMEGEAGQQISIIPSEASLSGSFSIEKPGGGTLSESEGGLGGIHGPLTLPESGTYKIVLDGSGSSTGSVKLTAYSFKDITGSIAPSAEGGKESVSIATPGQNARYSVTVGAGERVSVGVAKGTFNGWTALRWRNSKGEQISSEWWRWESLFWEPFEFSSAGTYTLEVDPESSVTGSADLTLWEVKDKSGESITPSTEGSSKTFSVDVPGQQNRIAMEGEAGQQISIIPSEASLSGSFSIEKPGGGTLSESEGGLGGIHGPLTLPESGTYKIVLDGSGSSTGSVKLTAFRGGDVLGTIAPSAEGGKESVSIATPGQNARYSVTVGAGERVSVGVNSSTFEGWVALRWLDSEGKPITSEWWRGWWGSWFWEPHEFSSAGTYTLEVDPESSYTGSLGLTLWEVKDKSGESITPSTEGSSKTFSVDVPGQQNRITFEGEKDAQVTLVPSSASLSGSFTIQKPGGGTLAESSGGLGSMHGPLTLPESGTYTIVLDGEGSSTGSVKLTAYNFKDLTGSIAPSAEGGKESVSIATPGQNARYSVTVGAGERVSVGVNSSTFEGWVALRWLDSEGKPITSEWWRGWWGSWFWEPHEFSSAGTYTLEVDPESSYTGSLGLTLWEVKDKSGESITPSTEGSSKTFSVDVPGQQNRIAMEGEAGQQISIIPSEASLSGSFSIEKPGGGTLSESEGGLGGIHGPLTLPESGTYKIVLDGSGSSTGSVKLTAYSFKDITGSIAPSAEGGKESVSIATPGQNARYSVTVGAGERVSVGVNSSTFEGWVALRWLDSEGKPITSEWWRGWWGSWFWEPHEFSSAGTYTLEVDPESSYTGSLGLTLWEVKDKSGESITPSTEGSSKTFSVDVPGQQNRIAMEGEAGQQISIIPSEASLSGSFSIEKPGGGTLSESEGGLGGIHGPLTLPESGTYKIVLDGSGSSTGSVKLTAYSFKDITGSIAPSAEGGKESVSIATPGQNARYSVTVGAGERVSVGVNSSTFEGWVALRWLDSEGKPITSEWWRGWWGSWFWEPHEFSSAGTYTLEVDPESSYTGSLGLTLWEAESVSFRDFEPGIEAELVSYKTDAARPSSPAANPQADTRQSSTQSAGPKGASSPQGGPRDPSSLIDRIAQNFVPSRPAMWQPPKSSWGTRGWSTEAKDSPWTEVKELTAPSGVTALSGQVLEQNGQAINGVKVAIAGSGASTTTDRAGRFLLSKVPAGHQVLAVDGDLASGDRFGTYEIAADLPAGRTTALESPIWLAALDPAGDQQISSPTKHETTLTYSKIPGLEVKLPAGTVIRNAAGRKVHRLNITAVPLDRAPAPLPAFQPVSLYYTIQPGRVTLSKGAQIIYPNWSHAPPGQRVPFWNYDAKDHGWFVYGHGTVTPDGKQIVPDPGVRIWNFSGAMTSGLRELAEKWAKKLAELGDPVDLNTGLFNYSSTDLVLPDTIPITIERTYRQSDPNSYSFGKGTQSFYDADLWSRNLYHEVELILPDSQRVHYDRISPGTGWTDAVYRTTDTPGPFFGSTIKWDGAEPGWDLKLKDGTTYIFGEVAPMQAIENAQGERLTLTREHGQTGNITKITSPHNRWVKFTYDEYNRITTIVDNGGRQLKYSYEEGLLTAATDLAGDTTEYKYDPAGSMVSVTTPRGNEFLQNEYDPNGRVVKQTTADGGTFEFAYQLDEKGKAESTTVTDPLGNTKKVWFDGEGRPITETVNPETEFEETMTFERQPKTNLLLSAGDSLGREAVYEYDSNGNLTEVTELAGTPEARTTKMAYVPGTSWKTEEVDPLGHATSYEYGPRGEMLKESDALDDVTEFAYNGEGRLASIKDPLEETTAFEYVAGDLAAMVDPSGRTYRQFVDRLGQVLSETEPGGQRARYHYDDAGRVTSETSPSGAKTEFEYNPDGQLSSIRDARGNETARSYDAMDRLQAETDALGRTIEWQYNKAGDLEEVIGRDGQVTKFAHDPLRRLSEARYGVAGETAESTLNYEYDAANRPVAVTDSASGEYQLSYNGFNQIASLEGPDGDVGYSYDAGGRREEMQASGLAPTQYAYDKDDDLIGVDRGEESVGLAYDEAGRTEAITLPNGIEERYKYDPSGRVTEVAYQGAKGGLGAINYAYDANGLLSDEWGSYGKVDLPAAFGSTEYNADNELVERNGESLEYDKEGNLVSDDKNEYAWNARGQLTAISGEDEATYAYDPFGRRISKTLGENQTDLLYDGFNIVTESIGGSLSGALLTGLQPDQIFSRTTPGTIDSYLTDKLGSTVALANEAGKAQTSYSYDALGEASESGQESDNAFKFAGREDDGNGLIYNRARYYSPGDARFISQDPASFSGSGSNLYWYADGNPLDFRDPSGEEAVAGGGSPVGKASGAGLAITKAAAAGALIIAAAEASQRIRERIENLPPGRSRGVKEGDDRQQDEILEEAEKNGRPIDPPKTGDREWELPDGTRVRERQSGKHGRTTEADNPDGSKIGKVHLPDE